MEFRGAYASSRVEKLPRGRLYTGRWGTPRASRFKTFLAAAPNSEEEEELFFLRIRHSDLFFPTNSTALLFILDETKSRSR